jgi:lipoprotein-anchoring transpeptidase ErfK/SrfK
LAPSDEGPAALRIQILLDRANFSVGQIDGRIGTNTIRALLGFRSARNLPSGVGVDDPVWKGLNQDNQPALISYTMTRNDLKGPFVRVPVDMMAKARLPHLGYASPLDEIAEKFHISPVLLQKLNPGKTFRAVGEEILVPNVLTQANAQAARVVVSRSDSTVTAFDDSGKIIAQYPATTGSDHDPLPIGEWKITGVSRNPKFHYNPELFWDAKPEHAKATIAAGPRNPVGLVWMDLSKEHYGIHGTPAPSRIGLSESHGCIRLTNWDALELAGMVKPGTPAILQDGSALTSGPPAADTQKPDSNASKQ